MCYYITATLPPGANVAEVREIAARFGRKWEPIAKGPVVRQLRAGETYYWTTPNLCDCDTALGRGRLNARNERGEAGEIEHLRRKGWSAAKIERALSQKWASEDRQRQLLIETSRRDAGNWLEFLRAALSSRASSSAGLLLHMYDGAVDDTRIAIVREPVSLAKIDRDFLLHIEEDRLYEFSR